MANVLAELKLHHISRVAVHCAAVLSMFPALGVASCAPKFAETDYTPYRGEGAAMLEGQAYVELRMGRYGDINFRPCVGAPVFLAPATAFNAYSLSNVGGSALDARAGRAAPYWRKSICDSQGRFTFSGVPAGNWIVATRVALGTSVPTRNRGQISTEMLAQNVTLRPGQNAVVMMTTVVGCVYDPEPPC